MKRILILLSVLTLISLAGCSTSSTNSSCKSGEALLVKKGDIIYEYDGDKLLSETEAGVSKTTYTYGDDGSKTVELFLASQDGYEETPSSKTIYDSKDNITGVYMSQSYVDSNNLYYENKYSDDFPLAQEWTMTYENDLLVKKEMTFSPYGDSEYVEYIYDDNGNVTKANLYVDGEISQQELYAYDDHNNAVFYLQAYNSSYLIANYLNGYDDEGLLTRQISINSFGTKVDIKNYYKDKLLVKQDISSNVNEGVISDGNLSLSGSASHVGSTIYEYDDCGTIITSNNDESNNDGSYLGTWDLDLDETISYNDNYLRIVAKYDDDKIAEFKSGIQDIDFDFNFENENTLTLTRKDKDLSATYSFSDNNGVLTLNREGSESRDIVIVYFNDDTLYIANGPLFTSYNLIEVYKKIS